MQAPRAGQWYPMLPNLPALTLPDKAPALSIRHRSSFPSSAARSSICRDWPHRSEILWGLSYCIN